MSEQEPIGLDKEGENEIVQSVDELPPLKSGYVRLVHLTDPAHVDHIIQEGLDYSSQGMIMSNATAYSDESEVSYTSDDPRFSFPGVKAVVIDIPNEEYRIHNDVAKSPGIIPAKYIVGVIEGYHNESK